MIKEIVFTIFLAIGNVLTISAFSTYQKEGMLLFFGGIIILSCTLCIPLAILFIRKESNRTVYYALWGGLGAGIIGGTGLCSRLFFFLADQAEGGTGAIVCGGLGAFIGAFAGLIAHFQGRPDNNRYDSPFTHNPKTETVSSQQNSRPERALRIGTLISLMTSGIFMIGIFVEPFIFGIPFKHIRLIKTGCMILLAVANMYLSYKVQRRFEHSFLRIYQITLIALGVLLWASLYSMMYGVVFILVIVAANAEKGKMGSSA